MEGNEITPHYYAYYVLSVRSATRQLVYTQIVTCGYWDIRDEKNRKVKLPHEYFSMSMFPMYGRYMKIVFSSIFHEGFPFNIKVFCLQSIVYIILESLLRRSYTQVFIRVKFCIILDDLRVYSYVSLEVHTYNRSAFEICNGALLWWILKHTGYRCMIKIIFGFSKYATLQGAQRGLDLIDRQMRPLV